VRTTVTNLTTLLNDPVFVDIASTVATLEAQAPHYDPKGDLNAAITLVGSLRTASDRASAIQHLLRRIQNVKNSTEALPQTMRNAA
jgi:hypothetical protein